MISRSRRGGVGAGGGGGGSGAAGGVGRVGRGAAGGRCRAGARRRATRADHGDRLTGFWNSRNRRYSYVKPGIRANRVASSKRCYRTAPSIAEVLVLPTISHSICSSAPTKQENGGVDGTRTRGLCRDRAAF